MRQKRPDWANELQGTPSPQHAAQPQCTQAPQRQHRTWRWLALDAKAATDCLPNFRKAHGLSSMWLQQQSTKRRQMIRMRQAAEQQPPSDARADELRTQLRLPKEQPPCAPQHGPPRGPPVPMICMCNHARPPYHLHVCHAQVQIVRSETWAPNNHACHALSGMAGIWAQRFETKLYTDDTDVLQFVKVSTCA